MNILMGQLISLRTGPLDNITAWVFCIAIRGFDSNHGSINDMRVVEQYSFEFWRRNLEASNFDEFLDSLSDCCY
jgi:hypothetical protein